ncbi:SURF1 family protein [Kribbella deserti]|uniref:SURF1-like protein n=1 Tax=Kribbella deserti TaxID=1926257 RepID=A0ABV6QMP4_9ACTN
MNVATERPTEPATSDGASRPLWRTALTVRWLSLLAVVLVVAGVMIQLGIWQYDVYESKTASATAQRATAAPVPLDSLFAVDAGLPAKAVGRRVSVRGTWGPAADQMFVSDRRNGDRDGFWVITPLMLSPTPGDKASGAVLIVRGWVPTPTDPAAAAPSGQVEVVGSVIASEAQDSSGAAATSRILPSLRIPTMVDLVDYQLYDAFVVQASATPPVAAGPAAVPPPAPPTDHAGLRNVAYAFQWWIFAAFAVFMWLRMLLDTHRTTNAGRSPIGISPPSALTPPAPGPASSPSTPASSAPASSAPASSAPASSAPASSAPASSAPASPDTSAD